ncbi:MAG: redox-regulated ATPase YchF, partial [Synechococcaceae bacterium WB5_2A_257]|nr:redox-regulated ATPase YchF [Synechococcaceae bacterium WB5_2A_257]
MGLFKITSEAAVASGIRRIEAITSIATESFFKSQEAILEQLKLTLKGSRDLVKSVTNLVEENTELNKSLTFFLKEKAQLIKKELIGKVRVLNGINLIAEVINLELALADVAQIDKRRERLKKQLRTSKEAQLEDDLLARIGVELDGGGAARNLNINSEEYLMIKPLGLLTGKPIIYAANVSEDHLAGGNPFVDAVAELAKKEAAQTVKVSAQVEAELVELGEDERNDYLEGLGVSEGGLSSLISATYQLLGLRTYFTTGEKETRAWTIKAGMTAPQAAGVIHTDFERGFIRAQTIGYGQLLEAGSLAEAKAKGWLRSEGKEYVVAEG